MFKSRINKETIRNVILHVFSFWSLFLSHHPEYDLFKGHTLNFGKVNLCIGCFVGYPTAVIGIILISFFNLSKFISYPTFLIIGIVLLSTFFLSIIKLTKFKVIKILQKILMGIGGSFIFWWIWYGNSTAQVRLFTFYFIFSIILGILNFYHAYGFFIKCYKCDTPFAWGSCMGFTFLRKYQTKYNLRNLFEEMDNFSKWLIQKREKKTI